MIDNFREYESGVHTKIVSNDASGVNLYDTNDSSRKHKEWTEGTITSPNFEMKMTKGNSSNRSDYSSKKRRIRSKLNCLFSFEALNKAREKQHRLVKRKIQNMNASSLLSEKPYQKKSGNNRVSNFSGKSSILSKYQKVRQNQALSYFHENMAFDKPGSDYATDTATGPQVQTRCNTASIDVDVSPLARKNFDKGRNSSSIEPGQSTPLHKKRQISIDLHNRKSLRPKLALGRTQEARYSNEPRRKKHHSKVSDHLNFQKRLSFMYKSPETKNKSHITTKIMKKKYPEIFVSHFPELSNLREAAQVDIHSLSEFYIWK